MAKAFTVKISAWADHYIFYVFHHKLYCFEKPFLVWNTSYVLKIIKNPLLSYLTLLWMQQTLSKFLINAIQLFRVFKDFYCKKLAEAAFLKKSFEISFFAWLIVNDRFSIVWLSLEQCILIENATRVSDKYKIVKKLK